MHPNAFLKAFWRTEVRDLVFVAMSFEPRFKERYESIIRPAIEAEPICGIQLKAYRVDNSKTGDSILTDIVDGIAHSRLVLADVSVMDEGRYHETPVRNGNVMYEVGVALACRTSSEVLIIRDDSKRLLFDVTTIPHFQLDFSAKDAAIHLLREKIANRLSETRMIEDARVGIAAQALTQDENRLLFYLAMLEPGTYVDMSNPSLGTPSDPDARGLDGLIRKGCIRSLLDRHEPLRVVHALNPFGFALAEFVKKARATARKLEESEPDVIPTGTPKL